ncbi:MAG: hypothetical protein GY705_25675 [Bacteroidetes bacterium]|nr:hypothetical protein [Bacteroidota bacterium]
MPNVVKLHEGLNDLSTRKRLLDEFHIEMGGGLGKFAGQILRIGLTGESSAEKQVNMLRNSSIISSHSSTCSFPFAIPSASGPLR